VPLWKAERGRNDDRYNLVKALSIISYPRTNQRRLGEGGEGKSEGSAN
jgi:hypothetical protein